MKSITNVKAGRMRIYTSYWGNAKRLAKEGVEPVAICRGKPKWFRGKAYDTLAPTWQMMRMPLDEFWKSYREMVERLDAKRVAEELESLCDGSKSIALMCYERNPEECHRHVVSEWMTESGITVVEWEPAEVVQKRLQMSMF